MALKSQNLLFLSLRDLQLSVDHLRLCILIGNGARRVCIVAKKARTDTSVLDAVHVKIN